MDLAPATRYISGAKSRASGSARSFAIGRLFPAPTFTPRRNSA
jgi:hypothetical protein